jgi:hypothetical protein
MSAPEKPAISAIVSPRSLDDFFVGFTPRETRYVVSEGDPQSEISELMLFPLWVTSGLPAPHPITSAFGGKADIQCPLLARRVAGMVRGLREASSPHF